jgi:hypothetical protein
MRSTAPGGVAFDNLVEIPAEYDPARPWPVRVQLHGGIMRQNPEEGRRRRGNRIPGEPQIVIQPFGWNEAAWWHGPQVENILTLVDRVKRQYNVDESRIYLTGTSDGGTGTYFLGMREPTPWASLLPLIGHIGVLSIATGAMANSSCRTREQAVLVVNGLRDPRIGGPCRPYLDALGWPASRSSSAAGERWATRAGGVGARPLRAVRATIRGCFGTAVGKQNGPIATTHPLARHRHPRRAAAEAAPPHEHGDRALEPTSLARRREEGKARGSSRSSRARTPRRWASRLAIAARNRWTSGGDTRRFSPPRA